MKYGSQYSGKQENSNSRQQTAHYISYPVGWTHAAKVISPDKYHSKMGPLFDIYHGSGNVLEPAYGIIYRFMRRKVEDKIIIDQIIAQEQGISIPPTIVDDITAKLDF